MDTTTALAFVPSFSRNVIESIDNIRCQYDKAYHRWMPHINFIFPYVHCNHFEDHARRLGSTIDACKEESIVIKFDRIGYFRQKTGYTFHLKPNEESEAYLTKFYHDIILSTLSSEIQVKRSSFHPHLTLGQCKDKDFESMKTMLEEWLIGLISSASSDGEESPVDGIVCMEPFNRIVMLHRSPATNDAMMIVNEVLW